MSQLIMMIARMEDFDNLTQLTEIWRRVMSVVELRGAGARAVLEWGRRDGDGGWLAGYAAVVGEAMAADYQAKG